MMSNPEFPEFNWMPEHEVYFCPQCWGEMILKMLPIRDYGTNNQESITDLDEIEAIRQMDPPPDDIEWMEMLMCTQCYLTFEPDEYDGAEEIYGL